MAKDNLKKLLDIEELKDEVSSFHLSEEERDKINTAVQPEDLSDVATSGSYNDLSDTPSIPAQVNLIEGSNITIAGSYPNLTVSASGSVEWDEITGDQSNVNLSGFTNDLGLTTVATTGDYDDLDNKPSLSAVATTGSYNDLTNTPTIPAQVNLIEGGNINITGIYPNLTIAATGGDSITLEDVSDAILNETLEAIAADDDIAALTPIADPMNTSDEAIATLLNELIAILQQSSED